MAGLDITTRAVEGDATGAIAEVAGVIDGTTVPKFQESMEDVRRKGVRRLVLDMSRVRYVNSTGLGELVKYNDKFEAAGGGLALAKVTAKVKIVMEMLGLHQKLEICSDERQALDALARGKGGGGSAGAAAPAPPRHDHAAASARAPSGRQSAPAAPARAPTHEAPAGPAQAAHAAGFPATVPCGSCGVPVEIPEPGNWKCARCYTLIAVKPDGSIRFMTSDRPPPSELSLTCTRECAEGLKAFVAAVAQPLWNGGVELERVKTAVGEIATVIANTVYSFDPKGVYHVQVETTPSELRIRVADHGRPLDGSRLESYLPTAARTFSEIECRPHPKGGNVFRMVKRK